LSSILVVDDNRSAAEALALVLRRHGHEVEAVFDGVAACERLDAGGIEVVLTDLRMEPVDGMEVLRHARSIARPAEVILMTGYGTIDGAVQALRLGARDFLTKPVTPDQVLARLQDVSGESEPAPVALGSSNAAARLRRRLAAVADIRSTLLLVGEPGSGRIDLARQIHAGGPWASRPFRVVARAGLHTSEELIAAGTILLPNVDLLEAGEQRDLLRLVEDLEARDEAPRIVATASSDWSGGLADPSARALYYRLAVLELALPPLRSRPEDLPELLEALLQRRERALGRQVDRPSPEELARLARHAWPGNLRELAAVAERALVFGAGSWSVRGHREVEPERGETIGPDFHLANHLERVERELLVQALRQCDGDRNQAGKLLDVERNTLRYKLKKHGLLDS
jgi:DNA-binding NtrC family response regulator